MTPRLGDALAFAAETHAGDERKGKDYSYLAHLMAVATLVMEDGGEEDHVVGALLHDCAEDHGGVPMLDRIERDFGRRVRTIVEGCSDSLLEEGARKDPWRPRKEAYIEHLRNAPLDVLRVSCADKLHNAREILADFGELGEPFWERFHAGAEEQLWYYESLAGVFAERLPDSRLPAQLTNTVRELRGLLDQAGS